MRRPTTEQDLRPINASSREMTTQLQLNSLLHVAATMNAFLTGPPKIEGVEYSPIRGEAPTAAESCFVKTCEAIEAIVSDGKRWDFSFQQKVEDDYAKAMQMNLEYIQAQRDLAEERATPHNICNPNLARAEDGRYVAFTGTPEEPVTMGIGNSPKEALEAFDEAFRKANAESIKQWSELSQNEQNQKMDGAGETGIAGAGEIGDGDNEDCPSDEADSQGGGAGPV